MSSEIDQFLASEAAQGLLAGQGEFQLDAQKAIEKLSRFALPEPGLWVLKMVQAAVCLGVETIDFTFQRRKVTVGFANAGNWNAESLLEQLLGGTNSPDSARRHLFSGILGAALGFSQEIEWNCGSSRVRVAKGGPVIESQEPSNTFSLEALRPYRSAFKSGFFTSPIRHLVQQTVQEYKALVDHSFVAPIRILVDKRPLGSSYQVLPAELPRKPNYDSDKSDGRGVMLAQIPVSGLGRPSLGYPLDELPLTTLGEPREKLGTLRLQAQERQPVEAVIGLYSCLQRRSRLNLIMDGVCLQRPLLFDDEGLGFLRPTFEDDADDIVLDVYLAVTWDDLDLSQFSVREQSFAPPVLKCMGAVCDVLDCLREECSKEWEFSKIPPARYESSSISLAGIAGVGVLSIFIPHAIVLGGIFGAGYVAVKAVQATGLGSGMVEKWMKSAHEKNVAVLKSRLEEVVRGVRQLTSAPVE